MLLFLAVRSSHGRMFDDREISKVQRNGERGWRKDKERAKRGGENMKNPILFFDGHQKKKKKKEGDDDEERPLLSLSLSLSRTL